MTIPQFADISSFQGSIDWNAYYKWASQFDGVSRVSMKSSEGVGYIDPKFETYRKGALDAGIDRIIYYHFARPDLGNTAIAEANWQHQVVGSLRSNDVLMLDYEVTKPPANATWAYEWLTQQAANYSGKLPTIYASTAYIESRLQDSRLAKFPLTLANWQFTPNERPACPKPWSTYVYVQYSDKATIPGIPGAVDANIYLGSEGEEPMTIDMTMPQVAAHFTESTINGVLTWTCKSTGKTISGDYLTFYRSYGGNALCGLTYLGLPMSSVVTLSATASKLYLERGCLVSDSSHTLDNPPGSGAIYLAHCYGANSLGEDPALSQALDTIKTLQSTPQNSQAVQVCQQVYALVKPLAEPQG